MRPPVRKGKGGGRVQTAWSRFAQNRDPWATRALTLADGDALKADQIRRTFTRAEIAAWFVLKLSTSDDAWDDT